MPFVSPTGRSSTRTSPSGRAPSSRWASCPSPQLRERSSRRRASGSATRDYLLIVTPDGEIAGHIEFFKPVSYWDAFELSYLLYDERSPGTAT